MSDRKIRQSIENLSRAMERLKEAVRVDTVNELAIDGTIQRFEFALELLWKTLKRALAIEGIQVNSPRDSLKESYAQGWLEGEQVWLDMLSDRNKTSHIYDEAMAQEIYMRIKLYVPSMGKVLDLLKTRYNI